MGQIVGAGRAILFVDDDAARAALVKGSTTSAPLARIVSRFGELSVRLQVHLWVERVPSEATLRTVQVDLIGRA